MALIECQDCGKEISDRATVCIHCGGPVANPASDRTALDSVQAKHSATTSRESGRQSKFVCVYCHSEDVKVLPLVVSSGTASIGTQTATVGIGMSGMGIGIGSASSKTAGTQLTDLARTLAKPEPQDGDYFAAKTTFAVGFALAVFSGIGLERFDVFGAILFLTLYQDLCLEALKIRQKSTIERSILKNWRSGSVHFFACDVCVSLTPDKG